MMRLPIFSCLILAFTVALHAEVREWTISGKSGSATFLSFDTVNDLVELKLLNQRVIKVPLANFSANDNEWLAKNKASDNPDAQPSANEFTLKWPDFIQVDVNLEVEEAPVGDGVIYFTAHYEFHSQAPLGKNVVREFARLFECVRKAVHLTPFQLDPTPTKEKFVVRLFSTDEDYIKAGGIPGSSGCYAGGTKEILVPLTSLGVKKVGSRYTMENRDGNQTLTHELTHQLTHQWLTITDTWWSEGWAEFMAAQRYRSGRMSFNNPGRSVADYIKEHRGAFDGEVVMLSPLDLLTITHEQWTAALTGDGANRNYVSATILITYFLLADEAGKPMWDYLRGIQKIGIPSTDTQRSALRQAVNNNLIRNRSREEMEKSVAAAMRRYGLKIKFVKLKPATNL